MKQARSADRRKHHVIYKTTCLVTGRYYIGMHSTDDLADGYIGSGKRLWQSIKKHGAEQHVCEVLEHLPSRDALRLREAELVNSKLLEDERCMNLALGGEGDWAHCNAKLTPEQRTRAGLAGGFANKQLWSSEARAALSERSSKLMKALAISYNVSEAAKISRAKGAAKSMTPECREKQIAALIAQKHSQGEKNSQFNRYWVSKQGQVLRIDAAALELYVALGYKRGKKG